MNQKLTHVLLSISLVSISLVGCTSIPTPAPSILPNTTLVPGRVVEEPPPKSIFDRIRFANVRQVQGFREHEGNPLLDKSMHIFNIWTVDSFLGMNSVTYTAVHGKMGLFTSLSSDQKEIIRLLGYPDDIRHFKTIRNSPIDEWLYEDKDYQIQFKEGRLVYFASIDQQAKTVLKYGQPNEIMVRTTNDDRQHEVYWYQLQNTMILFQDGKLVGISQ